MLIYKVINNVNGKLYIGQTTQRLVERWGDHCRPDRHKNHQSYLYNAIQKYGKDNFTVEEIDIAKTLDGLNILEEYYIKKFNTLAPSGYNLMLGGDNRECHEDTKAKISATLKGRPITNRWNQGNRNSPSKETRAKISSKLQGRPIEHRWEGGNTMPRTEEQKAHLSQLNKGKPNKALFKQVIDSSGVIHDSINSCALAHDLNRVTISTLIKSGKTSRTGFTFRFK